MDNSVIVGSLAAVASSLLTLFVVKSLSALKVASSLPRRVERLEATGILTLEVLEAQTDGLIAVAEAVSGKRCNGNVEDAIGVLRESKTLKSKFLTHQALSRTPVRAQA